MKVKTWLLIGAAMLACAPAPASAQGILSWLKRITQDDGSTVLRSTPTSATDPLPVTPSGNVASGAADSGNPVKVGCVYNSTLPVVTTGQRADCQSDANGNVRVLAGGTVSASVAGFPVSNVMLENSGSQTSFFPLASAPWLYNGTTQDRSVSIAAAQTAGTATGVAAVGGYQAATASTAINVSTAVTTQLVALSANKLIYVSSVDWIAAGTTNVTFEYGTGSLCGTGTTALTGAYPMTAQAGLSKGNGSAAFWIIPSGNALCMVNSQAIQVSGSVSYAQQ